MKSTSAFIICLSLLGSCSSFNIQSSPKIRMAKSVDRSKIQMNIASNIAAVPLMYGLMSFNEYLTHRFYQHTDFNRFEIAKKLNLKVAGGGHVEHHAETYDDMSLKTDDRWMKSPAAKLLNADKFRGTAFTWSVTTLMFLQMFVSGVPLLKFLLGFSMQQTVSWIIPSLLLHTTIWNTLHPNMHGLPDPAITHGPPGAWFTSLRKTKIFNFLYLNHQGHHVIGGQGNYNVCCPGMDHLLGTYVKEKDWRPKYKVPSINQVLSESAYSS